MESDNSNPKLTHADLLAVLQKFAGLVAHDVNNVLTPILGFGRMVEEKITDSAHKEDLGEIIRSAERGVALCNRFTRIAHFQDSQPIPCTLEDFLRSMEYSLVRILGSDVAIQWKLAQPPGTVIMDPQQFLLIVEEIASNAAVAMSRGGGTFRITSETSEKEVAITFSDSGPGYPAEWVERVGEPFLSTRDGDKFAGLGLALVRTCVEKWGGSFRLVTDAGGTTIRLGLVRTKQAVDTVRSATRIDPRRTPARILVVDEEAEVREQICQLLDPTQYDIETAEDEVQALARCAASETPFAAALIDLGLTEQASDGSSILTVLRSKVPGIRVVYMSSYLTSNLGAGDGNGRGPLFVGKPIKRNELIIQLDCALEMRKKIPRPRVQARRTTPPGFA